MPKKVKKKITIVREHVRHVAVSEKNRDGLTIVDRHPRRIPGTYPSKDELETIFKNHNRNNIVFPAAKKIKEFADADKYDELIAVWTDFFNQKLKVEPPFDPDIIKALIASESGFRKDPPGNPKAFGITQITAETLKILQNPTGEAKDYIFTKISQKDLKNPDIAIPMSARWLQIKKASAQIKLHREPNAEEIILEYKGLLKSKTRFKDKALENFRKYYALLKK